MDSTRNDTSAAPAEKTGPTRRFSAVRLAAWIVVSLMVAAVLLPLALTATPRQCTTCHEMQPYFDSWQASSHRTAVPNCLYCHVKPSILSWMAWEAGFYREIVGHFQGRQPVTTAANAPSVTSCAVNGCHSLNRETSASGDLKIDHRLHVVDAKIACPTCHAGAVHAGVGGRPKLPPMKLCKECHAKVMEDCGYCHTEQHTGPLPQGH